MVQPSKMNKVKDIPGLLSHCSSKHRVICKNYTVSYDEFLKKLISRKHIFKILQVNISDKEVEQLG